MDKLQNKIKSFFSSSQNFLNSDRVIFGAISIGLLCMLIIIVFILIIIKFMQKKSVFSTTPYDL